MKQLISETIPNDYTFVNKTEFVNRLFNNFENFVLEPQFEKKKNTYYPVSIDDLINDYGILRYATSIDNKLLIVCDALKIYTEALASATLRRVIGYVKFAGDSTEKHVNSKKR